ncbi:MAG TPA: hypothetical protein VHG28_19445 [Longimicrobiaceae bacterium]|nr:hypothetical protein [Longimicrobiaceae bacterium]
MLSSLLLVVAPFLALAAAAFGLFNLYSGILAWQRGVFGFGVFYTFFGIGGFALSAALWQTWRRARAMARANAAR